MTRLARHQRLLSFFVLGWMAVLPVLYYKRLWQIFSLGPLEWIKDNPSLDYSMIAFRALLASKFSIWILPNITEALTRAVISLIGAGLVFIAAQTLGALVCALMRCQFDGWVEKVVVCAGIGFGSLAYLSLGMALAASYRLPLVRYMILTCAAIGTVLFLLRIGGRGIHKAEQAQTKHPKWKVTIWQLIALLATIIVLISALAPEVEYDALWYHLWLPKLWLERGSPVDLIPEFISLYPLTWEMVYGAGLSMGGPVAAKLVNFSVFLLSGMLIYQTVRRYASQISAWLAIAIWITTPTVLWEAATAYNDLALGFFVLLTLYATITYAEGRQKQWLVIAGLNAGFALSTKHLALPIFALILAGLGLKIWLTDRKFKALIIPLITLAAIAFALALPWYLRSWQASGNPVFPELYNIFGAKPPQRWDAITEAELDKFKAHFGRPRTFLNLVTLPWDMTLHAASYGGNLGPIFLMVLPGLLFCRGRAQLIPWLGWSVFLFLCFWASPLSSFQMRFLIPIAPLLAILAAEGFERIRKITIDLAGEPGKRFLQTGLIVLCFLNLPPFTSLHELDRVVWDGWLTHVIHTVPVGAVLGSISEVDYISRKVPSYPAWQYINSHLDEDSIILTFSGGDQFYSDRNRIPSDSTIARQVVWIPQRGQERQFLEQIVSLGITHILFEKKGLPNLLNSDLAIIQPEVIEKWYIREFEDANFILYRVGQQ